jgi:hypothetical protein
MLMAGRLHQKAGEYERWIAQVMMRSGAWRRPPVIQIPAAPRDEAIPQLHISVAFPVNVGSLADVA